MALHILALTLQLAAPPAVPAAVVNVPRLIAESIDGKTAMAQLRALQSEKDKAIADRQARVKELSEARAQTAQIERARVELKRFTEDAQLDVAALDRQIQAEFEKKLRPVLSKIAEEDHIGILFEYPKQAISWFAPAVDITAKVIARLDAAARDQKKQ